MARRNIFETKDIFKDSIIKISDNNEYDELRLISLNDKIANCTDLNEIYDVFNNLNYSIMFISRKIQTNQFKHYIISTNMRFGSDMFEVGDNTMNRVFFVKTENGIFIEGGDLKNYSFYFNDDNVEISTSYLHNEVLTFDQFKNCKFYSCEEFKNNNNIWVVNNFGEIIFVINLDYMITTDVEEAERRSDRQQFMQQNQLSLVKLYDTVNPSNVETTNKQLDLNSIANDTIVSGDDYQINNYLNEDPNNVAFEFNNTFYLTSKQAIETTVQNKSMVKYECNTISTRLMINPQDIKGDFPLVQLNSIGVLIGGFVYVSQLKTCLQQNLRLLSLTAEKDIPTCASYQMLTEERNAVGASHCQEGQGGTIYNILSVPYQIAGKKKRKTIKRKYKGKKRRYTYKR